MTRSTATTPLEDITVLSLEFGRLLMECGASARVVDEIVRKVACGLGADRVDLSIGYASLAITLGLRGEGITRMRKVGPLGVNQRLDHSVREFARAVGRGELTVAAARSKLEALAQDPPYYPGWLVIIAVGMACASFGRLLGLDWAAFVPVFIAAALGQWLRRQSATCQLNVFVAATLVACIASALSGLGASLLRSLTVDTAMIASVLLLVPGVPALNAQNDIPMIPGGFAARAILSLIALTRPAVQHPDQTLILAVQDALRVVLTIGAMGTGLAIPSMLLRTAKLTHLKP